MRVPRSKVFALTGSVVVGALVTLQTAINGELAHRLGSGARAGVLAAVISFGTGLVVLTIALLVLPSSPDRRLQHCGWTTSGSALLGDPMSPRFALSGRSSHSSR